MAEKERKTKRVQLLMKPSRYEAYKKMGTEAGYGSFNELVDAALDAMWFLRHGFTVRKERKNV